MGEAADLQRGLWPSDQPVGKHYSVKEVLPKLLDLLDEHNIKITYFIETWNLHVYTDSVKELIARGHEIGWHAYQHEAWSKLSPDAETENFARSFEDIEELGIKCKGFRPPGGIINAQTLALSKDHGLEYISPAGRHAAIVPTTTSTNSPVGSTSERSNESIVVLPFKWATVDAYYYMSSFARLRAMKGEADSDTQLSPTELKSRYIREINTAIQGGGYLSLLFHPFLTNEPERFAIIESVVKYLAEMRDGGNIWLTRCEDVSAHITQYPDTVENDPGWDQSSWR